jgi:hypothetical protein
MPMMFLVNRFLAPLMTVAALALAAPAWAGGDGPAATRSRVILHGVDCSLDRGFVCDDDQPVFDEAIAGVPSSAVVVIHTELFDGAGAALRPLSCAAAEAVRDYFIEGGVDPEQVELQGCGASPAWGDGDVSIEAQLSGALE